MSAATRMRATIGVLLVLLLGFAAVGPAGAAIKHPAAEPAGTVLQVGVFGDSFSARPGNWTTYAQDPDIHIAVNKSISGATGAQVLAGMGGPYDLDVAIVEVGNNDVDQHVAWGTIQTNAQAIARQTGARHIIISAVGPSNITDNGAGINRRDGNQNASKYLASMAANNGWSFVDPFTSLKTFDNAYVPGMAADDGVHPSAAGMQVLQTRYDALARIAVYGSGPAS